MKFFFFGGEAADLASLARTVPKAADLASLARTVPKPLANVHPSLSVRVDPLISWS